MGDFPTKLRRVKRTDEKNVKERLILSIKEVFSGMERGPREQCLNICFRRVKICSNGEQQRAQWNFFQVFEILSPIAFPSSSAVCDGLVIPSYLTVSHILDQENVTEEDLCGRIPLSSESSSIGRRFGNWTGSDLGK